MTMKYRIEEIEYADGTKEFWTQEKRPFRIVGGSSQRQEQVLLALVTLPISIWFFHISVFYFSKTKHTSIVAAQKEIDDLLLAEAQKLEAERLKKLRNKIVKRKYTKYP